ncbi:MAG: hypothetical protein ACRD19_11555 [Terriglobia bacterium]
MTQAQHTPGPWEVKHLKIGNQPVICAADGIVESVDRPKEAQEANARLIAAAPDLLSALIDLRGDRPAVQGGICQWCGRDYIDCSEPILDGDCPDDDCPHSRATAAIAKASVDIPEPQEAHTRTIPDHKKGA